MKEMNNPSFSRNNIACCVRNNATKTTNATNDRI
jgi:hypothetical protein